MTAAMIDQLTAQLGQHQRKQEMLADFAAKQEKARADLAKEQESAAAWRTKRDKLADALALAEAKNKELHEQWLRRQALEKAEREEIDRAMKQEMERVSEMTQRAHTEHSKALVENDRVKGQLEMLSKSAADSEAKIDAIVSQGTAERDSLRARGEEAEAKAKELEAKIAEIEGPLKEARQSRHILTEKLVNASKTFQTLQTEISEVSARISSLKSSRESLDSKYRVLQREVHDRTDKFEKVKHEHNLVQDEQDALEKQKAKLETQVATLSSLCEKLASGGEN